MEVLRITILDGGMHILSTLDAFLINLPKSEIFQKCVGRLAIHIFLGLSLLSHLEYLLPAVSLRERELRDSFHLAAFENLTLVLIAANKRMTDSCSSDGA